MTSFRIALPRSVMVAGLGLLVAACGGADESAEPDAAQTAVVVDPVATPADTASMGMGEMAAAQDADQEFLRMMSDHHQGLIQMSHQAMERGGPEVQAEARALDQKQDAGQEEMLAILQREYNDPHQPSVMPSNQAMADSLAQKTGEEYDMTYRMNVIAHHREGIQMIDEFLPRLTRPEVRAMAERMKAEQTQDIQELEAEMGEMDHS